MDPVHKKTFRIADHSKLDIDCCTSPRRVPSSVPGNVLKILKGHGSRRIAIKELEDCHDVIGCVRWSDLGGHPFEKLVETNFFGALRSPPIQTTISAKPVPLQSSLAPLQLAVPQANHRQDILSNGRWVRKPDL